MERTPRPPSCPALGLCAALTLACGDDDPAADWSVAAQDLREAVMSIGGTSPTNVWAVGADRGAGPLVLHHDGAAWTRLQTEERANLWWVHAFPNGPVFMSGGQSTLLRYQDGQSATAVFSRVAVRPSSSVTFTPIRFGWPSSSRWTRRPSSRTTATPALPGTPPRPQERISLAVCTWVTSGIAERGLAAGPRAVVTVEGGGEDEALAVARPRVLRLRDLDARRARTLERGEGLF